LFYNWGMKRVYLADARPIERSDLRLLLVDRDVQVVGEATGWSSVLNHGPTTHPDIVVVDWGLNLVQICCSDEGAASGLSESSPGGRSWPDGCSPAIDADRWNR